LVGPQSIVISAGIMRAPSASVSGYRAGTPAEWQRRPGDTSVEAGHAAAGLSSGYLFRDAGQGHERRTGRFQVGQGGTTLDVSFAARRVRARRWPCSGAKSQTICDRESRAISIAPEQP